MIYTSAVVMARCDCGPVTPALPGTSDQHRYVKKSWWQPVQRAGSELVLPWSLVKGDFHCYFLVETLPTWLALQKLPALPSLLDVCLS